MNHTKRLLILGSGGFVGRNLVKGLSTQFDVYGLRHKDLDLLNAKAVQEYFAHHEVAIVLHCSAVGGNRLTAYDQGSNSVVEQNLRMFFNVAWCIQPHQRLIYFGSGAEYDRTHYKPKMEEEYFDQYVPADAYGFAKYVIAKHIAQHENMLDLRIFGLYGPGEDYRYKFISNAIIKALMGMPITIAQNVVFDYLYVHDFCCLVANVLKCAWPYRHMNITPTHSIDLVTAAEIINDVTGNTAGIKILNPGLNTEYTGNNSRLLQLAGPFAFTSYRVGIAKLVEYYRSVWSSLDLMVVREDPYLEKCIIKK